MRSVLLVHSDADRWLESAASLPFEVTPASSAMEARAYLAGTTFDAVWIGPDVEGADRIGALRDALGLDAVVEPLEADEIQARLQGAVTEGDARGDASVLEGVRDELSRVAHDLNNPLAVISGNAQLAAEMAKAVPTDETIVEAIGSIQQAASELEALFADVAALRKRVDQVIG
ncbi:histidine kinase dimerization/phospho-acceptor domain-containing protein [Rubrivirga sp.]|uniref:histidine kinase dimerization/phospho-acceptor domain-containing protein n=1 Tax=Rubrivirga sp. TaxID=1885344 RepID=UPI003C773F18